MTAVPGFCICSARRAIAQLLWRAIGAGLLENNPVIGTKRPKEPEPGERVLTDEELIAVWNTAGDSAKS